MNDRVAAAPPASGMERVGQRTVPGTVPSLGGGRRAATGEAARGRRREVIASAGRTGGGKAARGRRRLSVDERRDELIEAALQLFSARPPEDVSIDDVAEMAGASRALVYHYFGGKYELYISALRRAAKQLSDLLEPPAEGKPLERLRIALSRYFDFVESYAAGFAALLRGGPADRSGEVGEIVDRIRQLLLGRILHGMNVDEPDAVLRITLRSWMASVETAGLDWLENRDVERAMLERLLVDQLVVLLHVAGQHDGEVAALFARLTEEELA